MRHDDLIGQNKQYSTVRVLDLLLVLREQLEDTLGNIYPAAPQCLPHPMPPQGFVWAIADFWLDANVSTEDHRKLQLLGVQKHILRTHSTILESSFYLFVQLPAAPFNCTNYKQLHDIYLLPESSAAVDSKTPWSCHLMNTIPKNPVFFFFIFTSTSLPICTFLWRKIMLIIIPVCVVVITLSIVNLIQTLPLPSSVVWKSKSADFSGSFEGYITNRHPPSINTSIHDSNVLLNHLK